MSENDPLKDLLSEVYGKGELSDEGDDIVSADDIENFRERVKKVKTRDMREIVAPFTLEIGEQVGRLVGPDGNYERGIAYLVKLLDEHREALLKAMGVLFTTGTFALEMAEQNDLPETEETRKTTDQITRMVSEMHEQYVQTTEAFREFVKLAGGDEEDDETS